MMMIEDNDDGDDDGVTWRGGNQKRILRRAPIYTDAHH
jgi:hypothetical protein